MARKSKKAVTTGTRTESYLHPEATMAARPEAGQQSRFRKKKPKTTYRYDSSLAPEMNWDGQNPAREHGEWLIGCIEDAAKLKDADPAFTFKEPREFNSADGRIIATVRGLNDATEQLKRLSQPYLDWSGKAERLSFNVPTLPLFVHERLSTQAIIETLKSHRKDANQSNMFTLFGDPQRPLADAITKAYEHQDKWVNRLVLGDSLVVMNSLLQYEGLGGQVQMIYVDPPYGVKFGSNFQPFVRKREVSVGDDADMTREPEMVKAYRDTWEIGLHSYLTYLRDRLVMARELLHATGSVFVQIGDENLHYVRKVMDEVFGPENFIVSFLVKKTGSQKGNLVEAVNDHLIWFARDINRVGSKFKKIFIETPLEEQVLEGFNYVELADGTELPIGDLAAHGKTEGDYINEPLRIYDDFPGARIFAPNPLTSGGYRKNQSHKYLFKGREFDPGIERGSCWKHTAVTEDGSPSGLDKLSAANRLFAGKTQLRFKRYVDDFGFKEITNWWDGLGGASNPIYVVQTNAEIIKRCIMMTTEPGDLVLDPTCGSGTTAFVAETWGRRWITIDTSRVPLSLARQRLSTAIYPYFDLKNEKTGPAGGFKYSRKKNRKGAEVGGIVPHITSSTIANDEPPEEEVIVDRPDETRNIVRVTGPFCVEATIPTPLDLDGDGEPDDGSDMEDRTSFVDRMLDTLRRANILQLAQGRSVTLKNIRLPAKTLALSAEAMVDATSDGQKVTLGEVIALADEKNKNALPFSQRPVAIVFGPENGAVSERLVYEAAQEAAAKKFTHLYVIGFSIQPNAEHMIGQCEVIFDIPATWVPVTPDVVMGDLLKTTRASQIFSIAGRPEIDTVRVASEKKGDPQRWQVKLGGLNTFDPVTMEIDRLKGDNVPCWMLDPNYNGRVFMATQVFFPRTKAWEGLKKALKATHDETVWDHLAGSTSAPFEAGEHNTIAVKVIDDRGNELMVVRALE